MTDSNVTRDVSLSRAQSTVAAPNQTTVIIRPVHDPVLGSGDMVATRCVELERHDKLSKTEAEPDILILRSMHQSHVAPFRAISLQAAPREVASKGGRAPCTGPRAPQKAKRSNSSVPLIDSVQLKCGRGTSGPHCADPGGLDCRASAHSASIVTPVLRENSFCGKAIG